jgi:hypothetical protein
VKRRIQNVHRVGTACLLDRHRGLQLQAIASRRLIQNIFHVWVGLQGFDVVIHNSDRMSCAYVDVARSGTVGVWLVRRRRGRCHGSMPHTIYIHHALFAR